jgi:protein-disulfide isomerase
MIRKTVIFLAVLCLMTAQARIGSDSGQAAAQLEQLGLEEQKAGILTGGDAFSVSAVSYGDVLFAFEGHATLSEGDARLLGGVVGIATGLGPGIAAPVAAFLAENGLQLLGRGPVDIPVEGSFLLVLDVSEAGPDGGLPELTFKVGLHEVDEALFPPARHTLGSAGARFVIREFSDFQCPYCANFSRDVLPLLESGLLTRGDVRFEFHHLPLVSIHANAVPAAEAVECVASANGEDAFWSFGATVFERLQAWQGLADTGPYFIRLASELGLATDGVEQCLAERTFLPEIQASYQAAVGELQISGTPAVFVNGFKVAAWNQPESYLELIEVIDARSLAQ